MTDDSSSTSTGKLSPNFGHLHAVDPHLALLGAKAERYVFEDPINALLSLRQLGEALAQQPLLAGKTQRRGYSSPPAASVNEVAALRVRH